MRSARWPAAVALSVVLLSVTCVYTTGWQERKHHSTIREDDHFVRAMLSRPVIALVAAALLAVVSAMRPDVAFGSVPSQTQRSNPTTHLPSKALRLRLSLGNEVPATSDPAHPGRPIFSGLQKGEDRSNFGANSRLAKVLLKLDVGSDE
jgi:MFS superfamily sulfate permease-like transporter